MCPPVSAAPCRGAALPVLARGWPRAPSQPGSQSGTRVRALAPTDGCPSSESQSPPRSPGGTSSAPGFPSVFALWKAGVCSLAARGPHTGCCPISRPELLLCFRMRVCIQPILHRACDFLGGAARVISGSLLGASGGPYSTGDLAWPLRCKRLLAGVRGECLLLLKYRMEPLLSPTPSLRPDLFLLTL